jgi:formate-dependent nitrite reductase membrane component NrfD
MEDTAMTETRIAPERATPRLTENGDGAIQQRRWRTGRGEVAMVPEMTPTSYYGRQVLKAPVWKPEVGLYLYTGGLAGGSAMLAATARARGNDVLARRALYSGLAGAALSPALLIKDLGMPHRFHNMLRVLKVTSPMNIGTWILSGAGTALGVAAACETLGILPGVKRVAEASAGALGPALSTYTAVLLSDTAVPAWHQAYPELPFLFAGSAAATAGAAATLLTPPEHAGLARSVALGGVLAELAATEVMERRLGEIAEPYHEGEPGRFGRLAKGLGLAGAAVLAVGGRRSRPLALLGSAAVLAGSLCERWAIFKAGTLSTNDPKYTVDPQRRRREAANGVALR